MKGCSFRHSDQFIDFIFVRYKKITSYVNLTENKHDRDIYQFIELNKSYQNQKKV